MTVATLQRPARASHTASRHLRRTDRVLHLINGEHYAGAERVQDLLAQALPEQGFEVGFACIKPGKFPASRESQNVPLFSCPMRSKYDVRTVRDVARLIRQGGYSLVHTHTPRSALVGRLASLLARVPMVHHVHSHTSTEVGGGWKHRLNAAAERLSLLGVSRVIAVSQSSADYMCRQGVCEDSLAVVPNGIRGQESLPEKPTPCGTWTLGIVGLFRPRKGLEVLLRALAALKSHGRAVRLRAVGPFETPQYEAEIHRVVAGLGLAADIDWRGFRSNVSAELAAMDLFVFPSILPEGMPMVLLEAMAAGVPVIGTDVPGVTDVIRDGGDGLLVPPGDADILATAIDNVMDGRVNWQTLRQTAHARQSSHFSAASMAAGVADVYRNVLAERA
jgi:glycosyltransferase involved in cell wall biosynthesis